MLLDDELDFDLDRLNRHLCSKRGRKWRDKIRQSRKNNGGADVFAWSKGDRQPPISAIRARPDKGGKPIDVNQADQMFDALQIFWGSIWGQQGQLDYAAFISRYGKHIRKHPCDLPYLTGQVLFDMVQKISLHRAVACDGWRIAELKLLARPFFDWPALLFIAHEAGAPWPPGFTFGIVTSLAKCEIHEDEFDGVPFRGHVVEGLLPSPDPSLGDLVRFDEYADTFLDQELHLVAPEAKDTRPITNLSLWFTLWEKVRYVQRKGWRASFMHSSMHGTARDARVVPWRPDMIIERLHNSLVAFSGSSIDRQKIFDLLQS